MFALRSRRESLGLTALQFARMARCPVETVLQTEFGIRVPDEEALRERLATAYQLTTADFLRLALEAAELFAERYCG